MVEPIELEVIILFQGDILFKMLGLLEEVKVIHLKLLHLKWVVMEMYLTSEALNKTGNILLLMVMI